MFDCAAAGEVAATGQLLPSSAACGSVVKELRPYVELRPNAGRTSLSGCSDP